MSGAHYTGTRNLEVIDFVYTFNVLEHIEDDAAALTHVGRALRHRGKLLGYVPAFEVLYTSMDRWVGHLRRCWRARLRSKVEGPDSTYWWPNMSTRWDFSQPLRTT